MSMPPRAKVEFPIGRLSGVRVGHRQFQIETEYSPPPASKIVSRVVLGEQVVKRQETVAPTGLSFDQLWALLDDQHFGIEHTVRGTIDGFFRKRDEAWPTVMTGQISAVHNRAQEAPPVSARSSPREPAPESPPKALPASARAAAALQLRSCTSSRPPAARVSSIPPEGESPPSSDKDELFDMGLRKWRLRDYDGALVLLEAALTLDPADRAVQATLRAVRRKVGSHR